jgi:hypothetical protein
MERKTITISKKEKEIIEDLLSLTGDKIYDKYGYKRDETVTKTAVFENGIEADIKLVICEGDSTPYTEGVLFKHGSEVTHTDVEDEFVGEWEFEYEGEEYIVNVVVEGENDV